MHLDVPCRVAVKTSDGAIRFGVADRLGDGEFSFVTDGDFEPGAMVEFRLGLAGEQTAVFGVADVVHVAQESGSEGVWVRGQVVSMSVDDRRKLAAWEEETALRSGQGSRSSFSTAGRGRSSLRAAMRGAIEHRAAGRRLRGRPDEARVEVRWRTAGALADDLERGLARGMIRLGPVPVGGAVTLRMILPDGQTLALPAHHDPSGGGRGLLRFTVPFALRGKLKRAARAAH